MNAFLKSKVRTSVTLSCVFSPVRDTVVTNDRWGYGSICKHGGYYTCNDRYNPGHLLNHKWENCMTIDQRSWGYRREAKLSDYLDIEQLIQVSLTFIYIDCHCTSTCSIGVDFLSLLSITSCLSPINKNPKL